MMKVKTDPSNDAGDEKVAEDVDVIVDAIGEALVVNFVADESFREKVFRRVIEQYSEAIETRRIDGRIYDHGGLLDGLRLASQSGSVSGKKTCILLDHWSAGLIGPGEVELFRNWLGKLERGRHTLVFGTETPMASRSGGQIRQLMPTKVLADLRIIRSSGKRTPGLLEVGLLAGGAALIAGISVARKIVRSDSEQAVVKDTEGAEVETQKSDETTGRTGRTRLRGLLSKTSSQQKMFRMHREIKQFEATLEWMEPSDRSELISVSAIDLSGVTIGEIKELAERASNARDWLGFLWQLAAHDRRIAVESREQGFVLEEGRPADFAIYLVKVGYEPEEFVTGLFRISDLIDLFAEFDPAQCKPQEFLREQLHRWLKQKSVELNPVDLPPAREAIKSGDQKVAVTKDPSDNVEQPSGVELFTRSDSRRGRPVRRLYQRLVELDGKWALAKNLEVIEDYARLRGSTEPRFCEWVYNRMEKRELIDGLAGAVIQSSDEVELRETLGLAPERRSSSWPESIREVLREIGVCEPELPPRVASGVAAIRKAGKRLGIEGTDKFADFNLEGESESIISARKGMERFLKLYTTFLWNGGLQDTIIAVSSEGRQGFKGGGFKNLEEIQDATAGVMNYLLQSVSEECSEQGIRLPFMSYNDEEGLLWPQIVFQRTKSLINTLNKLSHDSLSTTEEQRRLRDGLPSKLSKFIELLDNKTLRTPEPVQFFRRHDDGHGIHYEGYTAESDRRWFYEVEEDFELGKPYLFLAATNPAAVDMTCVPFPKVFWR